MNTRFTTLCLLITALAAVSFTAGRYYGMRTVAAPASTSLAKNALVVGNGACAPAADIKGNTIANTPPVTPPDNLGIAVDHIDKATDRLSDTIDFSITFQQWTIDCFRVEGDVWDANRCESRKKKLIKWFNRLYPDNPIK